MHSTDIPQRFAKKFGENATSSYIRPIPTAAVTPTPTDAPASFEQGFPPQTFADEAAGGTPPNGKDVNGILNMLSAWVQWQAAGGAVSFDNTFSAAVGGYPAGARLASSVTPGLTWVNTGDGNTTDPDSGGATGWIVETDAGHNYNVNGGYFTVGKLIVNFGHTALTDSSGRINVTFAKPFVSSVLWPGAVNDSGSAQPSSWSGVGNISLTGMTVGMAIAPAGGGSGVPAGAGTASFWWAVGI